LHLDLWKQLLETRDFLKNHIPNSPIFGVILGSGLGNVISETNILKEMSYSEIPHFPVSTVKGHKGRLVFSLVSGVPVLIMQGRFHYYEGFSLNQITFPVRVMGLLGIKKLIITNAAGAINETFKPGDIMLITDHINLVGANPLIGPNLDELGPRFPSMDNAYSEHLRKAFLKIAKEMQTEVRQGVYAGMTGPTYETPAEIKMLKILGADAVGMSTVSEVIAAVHQGIEVLGISCITNMTAGHFQHKVTNHNMVVDTANKTSPTLTKLIMAFIGRVI
jgi:purine-nucleoside phosphorylase